MATRKQASIMTDVPNFDRLKEEDPWYDEMADVRAELDRLSRETIHDQRVDVAVAMHLIRARLAVDQALLERESALLDVLEDVNGC